MSSSSIVSDCAGDLSLSLRFLCFERLCLCLDPPCFLCFLCFFFFSPLGSFSSVFSCSSLELSLVGGDGTGDFSGASSSSLRRAFLGGGSVDLSSLEDLLTAALRLDRSRGLSEGLSLTARECWRVSGKGDGDCLLARDLDLLSPSGDESGDRFDPRDLGALGGGGGEPEADRLLRDFALTAGEADET